MQLLVLDRLVFIHNIERVRMNFLERRVVDCLTSDVALSSRKVPLRKQCIK